MTTLLRFLQFFTLGVWIGSILYFGAIVAPAAFTAVSNVDQVGAFVGLALGRLHLMGIVAGVIYLIAAMVLGRSPAALLRPAPLLVLADGGADVCFAILGDREYGCAPRADGFVSQRRQPAIRCEHRSIVCIHSRCESRSGVLFAGIAALVLISRKPAP